MGILFNAIVITLGALLGSVIKINSLKKINALLGICVIIISAVGFVENIFKINQNVIEQSGLLIVIICIIVGYLIGELLKFDDKILKLSSKKTDGSILNATLFFAVGGLEITGPILLAVNGDNSLLYYKCLVDFPFAILLGSTYGKKVGISAIFVALIQVIIFLISKLFGDIISVTLINQLCATGYVILFLSGFNLLVSEDKKIKTVNTLPAVLLIIIYNAIVGLAGV